MIDPNKAIVEGVNQILYLIALLSESHRLLHGVSDVTPLEKSIDALIYANKNLIEQKEIQQKEIQSVEDK